MLWTVQNQQATKMNALDQYIFGSGTFKITATGGQRKDPIPYPFDWVELSALGAGSDSKTLPVRAHDMAYREPMGNPIRPGEDWNNLVQQKKVTIVMGAEADRRDPEELYFNLV